VLWPDICLSQAGVYDLMDKWIHIFVGTEAILSLSCALLSGNLGMSKNKTYFFPNCVTDFKLGLFFCFSPHHVE